MKKINRLFAALLLCAVPAVMISCSDEDEYTQARITEFSFLKSANSDVLTSTLTGSINDETKTITVTVPSDLYESSANRKTLTPKISVSGGAQCITNTKDFSSNPTLITVSSKDENVTYSVILKKKGSSITRKSGALFFTEYYNASSFSYKSENNQFLEISNASSQTLDLSDVYLNRHVWLNGVRRSDLDQSVPLEGITLPAGQALVIYSQRCSWFTSSAYVISDASLNGIISFSGQDGFTLTCNGEVLDALGPEDGEGNGLSWGIAKQMQRKSITIYTHYKESEWLTTSSTESKEDIANTAGYKELRVNTTSYTSIGETTLTYFNFENTQDFFKTTIGTNSITINFYSDDASLLQSPAVSSDGGNIRLVVNGKEQKSSIVSGETEIDFSTSLNDDTGKLILRVYSSDGQTKSDYKIKTIITPYNMNSIVAGNYIETDSISDNDVVLIVQKNSKVIMGSTNNSGVLSCVSLVDEPIPYESGMAAVCVTIDNEGYYTFTFNNKFLTSKSTGSGLTFESSPSDYSLWSLEKQSKGTYVINNKAAVNGSRVQALEYYNEKFTTYGTGTGDAFEFTFYKK
ncbi:hypothetical protein [Treponema sp.]|jgi:hypothetical protein|uniref:hypothetical protein n=1 Tax=Treponema sp. TaxID=166 RepID=UPI00257F6A15|nr:hypothetical protein [Treponema sp.]MBE6354940.1 lamin tail domain-containing protein [Treponema sp.]